MRVALANCGTESAGKSKPESARTAPVNTEQGTASAKPDKAHFSFDPPRVEALKNWALAQPEIRRQRVDRLRQSLARGEYLVTETQLADAIIADVTKGSAAQTTGSIAAPIVNNRLEPDFLREKRDDEPLPRRRPAGSGRQKVVQGRAARSDREQD